MDGASSEAVVAELCDDGYLDDARYAERYAEDRRALDGWGAQRIARGLRDRGVDPRHISAAVATQGPEAELEAAVEVLRRRAGAPPEDDRGRERALHILVRRGYQLELAYEAVRAFERDGDAA